MKSSKVPSLKYVIQNTNGHLEGIEKKEERRKNRKSNMGSLIIFIDFIRNGSI